MSPTGFNPDDPSLSPATLELLLRLESLTGRLEAVASTLESTVGDEERDRDEVPLQR